MVIPRSRSRSMLSMNCALRSRSVSAPVASSNRSASVDLPWSMWAMIEKLRMRRVGVSIRTLGSRPARSLAAGRDVQCELPGKVMPFFFEHQVDPLSDVFGDRDARFGVQLLELLALLGGDVDGRGDLLPRHGVTMHDHRSRVKTLTT